MVITNYSLPNSCTVVFHFKDIPRHPRAEKNEPTTVDGEVYKRDLGY